MSASERLTRLLRLRPGETRPLAAMGSFLLLGTATTTILSAVKNGLFLSVYPGELIPHAVIAGALLTAVVAVVFTGFLAGVARRSLALGLTFTLAVSLVACRLLFAVAPRSAFGIYLWVSVVQVLVLTHAWDYASDLLTGRQTKRILPLIGVGASLGAIFGGLGVAPAAFSLGTENLLWVAVALMVGALPVLWTIREPMREPEEPAVRMSAVAAFVQRASRGLRSIASHDLLRLLAVGLIALTLTGTLIDLQLKFLLQETYPRDRITAIYGLLSAAVGAGTLLLQVWAARVLFPVHGVSVAAILHGGLLTLAAAGVAVFGGLYALVIAQALDDILQFSLQKPVEQVSLLPLPNRTKSVTLATLGGVLRPLSKASAGAFALVLGARSPLLPLATVAAALVATLAYSRHKRRYLTALEGAVSRHVLDLSHRRYVPLVVDAGAVGAIDKALLDADPTIVVFATSLLEQLPAADAMPRVLRLLGHPVPEVRAEAARVLRELDAPADFATGVAIAGQLAVERTPSVIATLLETIGLAGGPHPETIVSFLQHEDPQVRRAALVALGRLAWPDTDRTLRALLASSDPSERAVGAGAVGELGKADLLDALVPVLFEAQARHAALEALTALGSPAVPVMAELLRRRELPLPLRRSIVTALSG
ncbi:MAG TPA: hypothetical protein VFQ22_06650, partial [Longimicrobiales bacterium]|nr:hypothetical protein [Longimicrobiales bacterium]